MKILIVGAGIAGPTLAHWLVRDGHHITIVEKAPELRGGGYIVDFWGAGFDVAERMGIVPELRRLGYAMTGARSVNRAGRTLATIDSTAIMGPSDRFVSIARADLAAVIFASIKGSVELPLNDTIASIDDDGSQVSVSFVSGHTDDFDLVLGADGLHSRVRTMVFGPDVMFEKYLGIVVAAFGATGYGPRDELLAMMHADVGFQTVRVSLRDDRTLFLFSLRHDGPVPTERTSQEALLRERLAHGGWEVPMMLELMTNAPSFYFDSVSQIRMPAWSHGRVALLGDAAACPSFLAGQGSALAMVEAYTLAAELAVHSDHSVAFEGYQQRLSALVRSKQEGAVGLRLAFAPRNRFQLLLRTTIMRLMALPKVADITMGRSFRDVVELPPFPRT